MKVYDNASGAKSTDWCVLIQKYYDYLRETVVLLTIQIESREEEILLMLVNKGRPKWWKDVFTRCVVNSTIVRVGGEGYGTTINSGFWQYN